jgi:hypothetical protein
VPGSCIVGPAATGPQSCWLAVPSYAREPMASRGRRSVWLASCGGGAFVCFLAKAGASLPEYYRPRHESVLSGAQQPSGCHVPHDHPVVAGYRSGGVGPGVTVLSRKLFQAGGGRLLIM